MNSYEGKVACSICKSEAKLIETHFEGYVKGTFYEVYECPTCKTQFIPGKYDKDIYNLIYSQKTIGYQRYSKYAKKIREKQEPLKWLSYKEPAYLYVYNYLRDKSQLRILEVGCGDGYLTYAINQSGHYATGIDVSTEAINIARNLGNFFEASDIRDYNPREKFDLILLTETIEHLQDPNQFIRDCLRLLKDNGVILLTTPNKDFRSPNTTWQSELPPVHRFWFGKKSFIKISENFNLSCEFVKLKMPLSMERNNIISYFSSRGNKIQHPTLDKDGKFLEERRNNTLRSKGGEFFIQSPIKDFCNLIYNLFFPKELPTLGVILKKGLDNKK